MTGNRRTEYVYDGRGSVSAELTYNGAWYTLGGLLSSCETSVKKYSPFGEDLTDSSSGFGYNGEYTDAATGMIYLRARFYDPAMNRFSQKDALRGNINNPLRLNRYLYCENDPVNFVDASGRAPVRTTSAAKTATVSKSTPLANTYTQKAQTAAKNAALLSNEARMNGSSAAAQRAGQAALKAQYYSNLASTASGNLKSTSSTKSSGSMAGNSYSAATQNKSKSGTASSTGNTTKTPVPSQYSAPSSPNVSSNTAQQCTNTKGILMGISVAEAVGGLAITAALTAAVIAGTAAGGWLILGGALLGAEISSLVGGMSSERNGESFLSGWLGGEISGLITGAGLAVGNPAFGLSLSSITGALTIESAAIAGGAAGGAIGSIVSQEIESGTVDSKVVIQTATVNASVAGGAAILGTVPGEIIADISAGTAGKVAASGVSTAIEGVEDLLSATVTETVTDFS